MTVPYTNASGRSEAISKEEAGHGVSGAPRGARPGVPNAVEVRGLVKKYGATTAVSGASFTVEDSEIYALLGPNGAGKTTTLEILEGFRQRDDGFVSVLGLDPGPAAAGVSYESRSGWSFRT